MSDEKKIRTLSLPKPGDIQIDNDKSEWIIVLATPVSISRVKRNSLAHKIHAETSSEMAKSYNPSSKKDTLSKDTQ